jgi:hypothetical protein
MPDMTEIEDAVYGEIYPLMYAIEDQLNVDISHVLMTNMVRRLATSNMPLSEIITDVKSVYAHQIAHNARSDTKH